MSEEEKEWLECEEALIQNLKDAGCCKDTISKFVTCDKEKKEQQKLCLLTKYRACLLEEIHARQKQLDCLDYLIYKLKNKNGKDHKKER